jgi:hypothetical protein
MTFRRKQETVEATQWFKDGDHLMVARYGVWRPGVDPYITHCGEPNCGEPMKRHGWIGRLVCPGDWIVTGSDGGYYPVRQEIFNKTYEAIQ